MRFVAWRDADGRETWGIVGADGKVWDGGRHTGVDRAGAQAALCDAASVAAFVAALALPGPDAAWDCAWEELQRADRRLALPWRPPEVWAAGVTYRASEDARRRESQNADIYARVAAAARPELFFKATGGRVRGPGEAVGLRPDSAWQVPEPEVALVLGRDGRIVGYTGGNDMSCRDIEGENPLYLPQAKIYDGACALGPTVCLTDDLDAAGAPLAVTMRIEREGRIAFEGSTDTGRMVRAFADLVAWLGRAYTLAPGTVLLTGTGIVPPDDFSLRPGDIVRIGVEGVGELANPCEVVGTGARGEADQRWP